LNKKFKRNIQNKFEFYFMKIAVFWVRQGSMKKALKTAERIGWFFCKVVRIRYEVVLKNLRLAFPEKSATELESIALRSYQNFAKMLFEFVRMPRMSDAELADQCIFENPEVISDIKEKGRGAVFVAAHFDNWELMAAAATKIGRPMSVLVRKQRNQLVGDLINQLRTSMNIKIIPLGTAVRGAIKAIRKNEWVALLADQGAGRKGLFIDFFGVPSSTHQGPAVFALRTGAPLIFGHSVRQQDNRHRIKFTYIPLDDYKGVTDENVRAVTQIHAKLLEEAIRRNPDHWFWMHKRWKTKPPENTN